MWCRQLPRHMVLYQAETYSCSPRICGESLQSTFGRSQCSSLGFIINMSFRLLRVARAFKHASMSECSFMSLHPAPSRLSKAKGKYFSEAQNCHLPDLETGFMESFSFIPQSKRDRSYTMIMGQMATALGAD